MALNNKSFPPAPGNIHIPQTKAALVLKAKRPKLVQELPTCVHHSLSSCSPSGRIYPFWLEGESIVKHTDSLRLSPRAAFGLRQRKIFFFFLCIISYCNQTLDGSLGALNLGDILRGDAHSSNACICFLSVDLLRTPDPLFVCLTKAWMSGDNAPEMFLGNVI